MQPTQLRAEAHEGPGSPLGEYSVHRQATSSGGGSPGIFLGLGEAQGAPGGLHKAGLSYTLRPHPSMSQAAWSWVAPTLQDRGVRENYGVELRVPNPNPAPSGDRRLEPGP